MLAALVAAGCSSGSSGKPVPAPPSTGPAAASTTGAPFAGGINGPVSPNTSGPLGHG
jgi:hypothetical protein